MTQDLEEILPLSLIRKFLCINDNNHDDLLKLYRENAFETAKNYIEITDKIGAGIKVGLLHHIALLFDRNENELHNAENYYINLIKKRF